MLSASLMKLSFIIVNYNVTDLLRNCLHSIQKYANGVDYECVIIDNDSPDVSWKVLKEEFPEFHFIENKANEGFSKANNKAIQQAKGEYLLLLNPDTELEGNYIKELLAFADLQTDFGCLGVRFHDAKGNFLPECKRSAPDVINSFKKLFLPFSKNEQKNYYRNDIPEDAIAKVEVITGAFMLIKRKVYEEVGGLDERYFMYGEDIDLCYTLLKNGYQNWYYGPYSILHYKGESTIKDEKYLKNFFGAMQIYIQKYYSQHTLSFFFIQMGLFLRYRIALLNYSIKKAFS